MGPIIESKPLTAKQRTNRVARFVMDTLIGVGLIVSWRHLPEIPWVAAAFFIAEGVHMATRDKQPSKKRKGEPPDSSAPTPLT
jgi:hypothetical protein